MMILKLKIIVTLTLIKIQALPFYFGIFYSLPQFCFCSFSIAIFILLLVLSSHFSACILIDFSAKRFNSAVSLHTKTMFYSKKLIHKRTNFVFDKNKYSTNSNNIGCGCGMCVDSMFVTIVKICLHLQ